MAKAEDPIVSAAAGALQGTWKNKGEIAVFRGVPFAAPPVGDLRWRPPAPVESWSGERKAQKDGPTAIQRNTAFELFMNALVEGQGWNRLRAAAVKTLLSKAPRPKQSEDCLYLTVRTPSLDAAAKLPVMVWIHGGDHQDGSGTDVYYASNALAELGVVTVSINYRLGLMGYFAHPELAEESEHGFAGNYGTLDQIAALEWVRDNISGFGGDPDNVTIFGESAGGESVMHMMTSPLARGLFHRAIAQSPANSGQMIHLRSAFLDYPSAEENSLAFARALGVTGADQLHRLRQMTADELYSLVRVAPTLADHFPTIDGHVLPESPLAAFAAGRQADVPFVIGTNADEGTLLQPALGAPMVEYRHRPLPEGQLQPEIADAFGDDMAALLDLYPGLESADEKAGIEFMGDHMFGARAYWYAKHHAEAGHLTRLYHFSRVPPSDDQTAGAFHAAELPFVHGSKVPVFPLTDEDEVLAADMRRYWTNFARTADPNNTSGQEAELVGWPQFDPADPKWLRLDHTIVAESVDRVDRYEIFNRRTARLVADMAAIGEPTAATGG